MHFTFYIFLFIALWFFFVNVTKMFYKNSIPAMNLLIMAAAIVGCVWSALEMGHSCQ